MKNQLIGYNCSVCHGAKIAETDNEIIHWFCDGDLEPVYEKTKTSMSKPENMSECCVCCNDAGMGCVWHDCHCHVKAQPCSPKAKEEVEFEQLKTKVDEILNDDPDTAPQPTGELEVVEWEKQGRTEEQIWAVVNFMSGAGKKMVERLKAEGAREAREIIDLILPLAKGYAAANRVGSNQRYIEIAEEFLKADSSTGK
jgi:hypothetical protein